MLLKVLYQFCLATELRGCILSKAGRAFSSTHLSETHAHSYVSFLKPFTSLFFLPTVLVSLLKCLIYFCCSLHLLHAIMGLHIFSVGYAQLALSYCLVTSAHTRQTSLM